MKSEKDNTHKTQHDADAMIGAWLKKRLPDAPPQPWFTRNVMNRLPGRITRVASVVEYILYIIGIAASIAAAIKYYAGITNSGSVTPLEIIVVLSLLATAGAMAYALIAPWITARH